jgi:murein L,D-transpeptidase YcbB/YkuD
MFVVALFASGCATSSHRQPMVQEYDAQDPAGSDETSVVEDLSDDPQPLFDRQMLLSLEQAERQYAEIAGSGGWASIPSGPSFNATDPDSRASLLSERLAISGDLVGNWQRSARDQQARQLTSALRKFQARHGIAPSGVVDRRTLHALNVPADRRLGQLRANLARLRDGISSIAGSKRYVLVNPAAFGLEAIDGGKVVRRHRIIAGKPDRQTPSVKATIQNINFHPSWTVPESVARLDLIPHLQKEPDYLRREHFRVYTNGLRDEVSPDSIDWRIASAQQIRFRQDPGPWNALGLVRIDMRNEHNVYMHDTPMKDLFGRPDRAFSAGCIRVEGVFELVTWLLEDVPGWSRGRVEQALQSGMPLDVALPRAVPVIFTYVTAWAGTNGVAFREDIYNRDGLSDHVVASRTTPAGRQSVTP